MTAEAEEARSILDCAALSLPPPHVIDDLLLAGVCVRCIFRLFGVHGHAYSCSFLTASILRSMFEEQKSSHSVATDNGLISNGLVQSSNTTEESENDQAYCSICLGILQLAYQLDQEVRTFKEGASMNDFMATITTLIKREAHQIDGFSLEVSVPPVIMANERGIWLYLKRKYECEEWFKEKFHTEHISVKDALRLSIASSLENYLNAKSGVNSFPIRLTYTHFEASEKLQISLAKGHGCKRRNPETEDNGNTGVDLNERNNKDCNRDSNNESDAAIYRALNGLQDHDFCERFLLPPVKTYKTCQLTITCYRMPIYIGGRYLKYSRKVSQSRWIVDDERMGEDSVEEIVGGNTLLVCRGDNYKFHAAGREDIDVRMLGSGRPFLIEVSNARCIPSLVDIQQIAETINNSDKKFVSVRNLKVVGSETWTLMREGEAEKQKQYAALVWISRPLTEEDLQNISSTKNMDILQRTPVRVLHRRSPLERKRTIHWMMVEKIAGNCQYFMLHLCTQAGTYIKEFVHGDLGRTHPSLGSILGCRAEILQLDVTDVKMDLFD